ncbi:MAG: four helix bundle protein [Candidatus Desantisbacteria bacterium]
MKENIIKNKSFDFALRIVNLFKFLQDKKEFILSKQVLRSGTSIGAMVRESEHAESKADFIHKMSIAQKEANESIYWLELLYKSDYLDKNMFNSLESDIIEIQKLLSSIVISSKNKLKGDVN